jgi:hypothetical protein
MKSILLLAATLLLGASLPNLKAGPTTGTTGDSATNLEYKVISGFKQPFNDDLQLHFSKGWKPVGGIAVTTWNDDLYFAQLLSRTAKTNANP